MYRVIIADDEPKVTLLIRNLIQWDDLGLELVATAGDGIAALAAIETFQPDIVITDIRMPGYDGIELIERAKRHNPAIDFIIISGYRHFDYAQKAIRFGVEDYLLKPLKAVEINQTLRKMIQKYAERDRAKLREEDYSVRVEKDVKLLQEQFMSGLLEHSGDGFPDSLDEINRRFGLAFKADSFQAFVVKADVHFDSVNPNVQKLLSEKSVLTISELLSPKCHVCLLYPTERGVYGVANFSEPNSKALRRAMQTVIDELQSQRELFDRIKVTIGLGQPSTGIANLAASLGEAEAAIANRLIHGPGRIIERYADQDLVGIVNRVITPEVRKRLLQGIEILDESEIASVLENVASAVAADTHMNGKAIHALCDECIQILRFGLKSQNAVDDWVEEKQGNVLMKLGMCNSQRDIFHVLASYASSLVAHVVERKKSENSKPVREAQKYINAHYATPISLEGISQRAGFNPTYFSLLFKKETGQNFLEYVTDVRIKEAKRLLSDPGKTIADVAADVGYSDVKHFSKLFARITGIHPSKYRKLYY